VEQNGSVRRVSVVGNSGSGKSTVAAHLSAHLGVPHVELDAIFHQPGWLPLPAGEFRHRVALAAEGEEWVIDGDYSAVRDIVWRRADTVVWLDLPRVLVMRRVVGRTLARMLLRRELWNGNRERLRNLATLDPQQSIIAWSWTRHARYLERYAAAVEDPTWSHCRFARLRSPREVKAFLATLGGPDPAPGERRR
jgi:adenylate kinase family enzyme